MKRLLTEEQKNYTAPLPPRRLLNRTGFEDKWVTFYKNCASSQNLQTQGTVLRYFLSGIGKPAHFIPLKWYHTLPITFSLSILVLRFIHEYLYISLSVDCKLQEGSVHVCFYAPLHPK